mmetsp:Transcript_10107/g.22463  ORF Transcript_10107/g.22463 Transcript_10107/m.22463 type:complete len:364 (-) Transcript_10107:108-1199(-)
MPPSWKWSISAISFTSTIYLPSKRQKNHNVYDGHVALSRISNTSNSGSAKDRVIWDRCGLLDDDLSTEKILLYSKIRDECRRDAHASAMWGRRRELLRLLQNIKENSIPELVPVSRTDSGISCNSASEENDGISDQKHYDAMLPWKNASLDKKIDESIERRNSLLACCCFIDADDSSVYRDFLQSFLQRQYVYCSSYSSLPYILQRIFGRRPPQSWTPPGSVPFLCGLTRLFDLQSQEGTGTNVTWTIDADVLTEIFGRSEEGEHLPPLPSFAEDTIFSLLASPPAGANLSKSILRLVDTSVKSDDKGGRIKTDYNFPEKMKLSLELCPNARKHIVVLKNLCKRTLENLGDIADVRATGSFST